jgi:carbon-monoxide dehydrogenase medium subunit
MRSFELAEPATIQAAIALLDPQDPGTRVIAGGTALMLMMKTRLFQPTRLVSLRRLRDGLAEIRTDGQALRIGALTSLARLESSPAIASATPAMHQALRTLSNARIRNVATIGGHLAHGDPHMDLPPILLTLGAHIHTLSPRGPRSIAAADFFTGYYRTALAGDELITEVEIPWRRPGLHAWYTKYTALSADDWPTVGVAVSFRQQSGVIVEPRIAVSAATDRAVRIIAAESVLENAPASSHTFAAAANAAADSVQPLADIRGSAGYKREMVRVHVRRALESALASPTEAQ